MSYDYFYGQSGELFSYFRIPKALFQDSRFRQLSTDARTLYGILLDRMSLSAKNNWLDEQGRVYIIYTVREVQESLCCAEHKAVKLFRELEQANLIERKRRGLGRPSLIYVKNFSSGLPPKANDAARIQKKIKKIQKDLEAKQKELDDLKAETILVIRGVSALDKELLGTLVAEAKDALETLEKQLVQAQEEYEEATKTAKRSNYICNELLTWADVYDTANHDERRAILQQFIKEIRVRKDYEISITLNASFNQVEQLKAVSTYDGAEIFEGISEKGA